MISPISRYCCPQRHPWCMRRRRSQQRHSSLAFSIAVSVSVTTKQSSERVGCSGEGRGAVGRNASREYPVTCCLPCCFFLPHERNVNSFSGTLFGVKNNVRYSFVLLAQFPLALSLPLRSILLHAARGMRSIGRQLQGYLATSATPDNAPNQQHNEQQQQYCAETNSRNGRLR